MKPVLSNTEMVRAILDGRKTVTRRVVKEPWYIEDEEVSRVSGLAMHRGTNSTHMMPYPDQLYHPGDILYVRETFFEYNGHYYYKADGKHEELAKMGICFKWRPSIHMPKEAARLFLRVKDVRVKQLHDMTTADMVNEGMDVQEAIHSPWKWHELWDSTVKPTDRALYSWKANPWVWVIEFERIRKEEA